MIRALQPKSPGSRRWIITNYLIYALLLAGAQQQVLANCDSLDKEMVSPFLSSQIPAASF